MADASTEGAKVGDSQKNAPRKHHYVPVFYQKKFTNENGLLWVYDRQLQTYKELHPISICFKRDLYSIRPEGQPVDTQIETKLMSQVDGAAATAIRRLENGNGLDYDSFASFTFFAALQHQRLPMMDRDLRLIYAHSMEETMKVAFATPERAKMMIDRYGTTDTTVTPEAMVEAVQGKHLRLQVNESAFLKGMLENADLISDVLALLGPFRGRTFSGTDGIFPNASETRVELP